MKALRTLLLLADDAEARFFLNAGPGTGLNELSCLALSQFAEAQIEYEDRPGRQTGGPGGVARHGFDPNETADTLSRDRFARRVIEALDQEWTAAKADRLVIAAAPKMLGVLRKSLRGAPAAALAGDLAKDLMKIPAQDLPRHFQGLIRL